MFARGNNRQAIFADDRDRLSYLALLADVARRGRWRCLTYCLMPNHVHLLVETRAPNLSVGMNRLHGDYAQRFNRRHRRSGHLFQGRFGSVRVEDDAQLWMTLRYIVRNPVEAGLRRRGAEWPWTGHDGVARRGARCLDTDRVLEYLAAAGADPRRIYDELIED